MVVMRSFSIELRFLECCRWMGGFKHKHPFRLFKSGMCSWHRVFCVFWLQWIDERDDIW